MPGRCAVVLLLNLLRVFCGGEVGAGEKTRSVDEADYEENPRGDFLRRIEMPKKLRRIFEYRSNGEDFIDILTRCPECKGEGGERDVILDDGSGPWYRCEICEGKGYMNVFKKIYWKILFAFYEWDKKRQMRKGIR